MEINNQYQTKNSVYPTFSQASLGADTASVNGISFKDLLNPGQPTQPTAPPTNSSAIQNSAIDHAIGRNYFTAHQLAWALQNNPERWEQINKDAGLGLSNEDMMRYWNMNTSQLTDTLMKAPPEMFVNLSEATYGVGFGFDGWNLPQVVNGVTPEGVKSRYEFPLYGDNPLKIYGNSPTGFNPSYGRSVSASEYAAGLARWGSAPNFDQTSIIGGNGLLPNIPSGVGTIIPSNPSAQIAAYTGGQSVAGETLYHKA